jgi:transcriptional regulator with XRE-family HTH domain
MVKQTGKIDKRLGENILSYRLAKGVTRKSLSEGIGITHQQMQKYETGKNRISVSRLVEISDFLGVNPCFFLEMENISDNHKSEKNSKILSELIGLLNNINDRNKLEAIKNLIKSL